MKTKGRWPWLKAVALGIVALIVVAALSWIANRPDVEFVSTDGVVNYGGIVASDCWDLYRWRVAVWDRIGSGDWDAVRRGAWDPPLGYFEGRSCEAGGIGTLGPPLQARLPADAAPGVYRICELRECREFEYRP